MACSHVAVVKYWEESITSDKYSANECQNYEDFKSGACKDHQIAIMGENVNQILEGKYFLTTNSV